MKRLAAMGAMRLSCYMVQHGMTKQMRQYPALLDESIRKEELEGMEAAYMENVLAESGAFEVIKKLLKPEDLSGRIAWVCLELALFTYMNRQTGEIFKDISPSADSCVTVGLAVKILSGDESLILENEMVVKEAFQRVELLLQAPYPTADFYSARLQADARLVDWLSGGADVTLLGSPFLSIYDGKQNAEEKELIFREVVLEKMCRQLESCKKNNIPNEIPVAVTTGEERSGRSFLIKKVADKMGHKLLFVPAHYLGTMDELLLRLRKLLREVLLQSVELCITGMPSDVHTVAMLKIITDEYERVLIKAFEQKIGERPSGRPLFLTTDEKVKVTPILNRIVCQQECKLPNMGESVTAWDYFAEKYLKKGVLNSRELAVKMKLPFGDMERIVKSLISAPVENPYDSSYVFKCCYELLDDGRYDNIKRVEAKYTIDDLKLEASQKQIIRDICNQVEYRRQVLDEWNLRSRYSYGTSVSALFSGPPGTGKTMAVHVMAGILGLELYKVDLSQLVDKYIGETEKRLEEVFSKAERSNMILFFDEADSIIGKRSEVKESKDKYANNEVSFLLQRIEEFDGIVILATNYSQNIDAAFMRRIRFTVHFPLPDEATRKEIWKSSFSKEVPMEELDFDFLANKFEFSGGQIKNVVLNATFFAAAENKPVSMAHLVRAVWLDKNKDKKVSFQEELGEYAYLLRE